MSISPSRIMLLYWGRRGALTRFTLELARVAASRADLRVTVSASQQNEAFASFLPLGPALFPVSTFRSTAAAVFATPRLLALRRNLARRLEIDGTRTVIALMPHVWSQLVIDVVHGAGARYLTIVHDAVRRQGGGSPALHEWLLREVDRADGVITLSRTVAAQLIDSGRIPRDRVSSTFLPDIDYGKGLAERAAVTGAPFRLLFFGRIVAYKGLAQLVDVVERLRASGRHVALGVYGDGDLADLAPRLRAIDAVVVNRWIAEDEVADVFSRHDAVVLSHTEASQSGVAAAAFGSGIPVVALPVGGISEQIQHGATGLLARRADVESLADAIAELIDDPTLVARLRSGIARTRSLRSMDRFLDDLVSIAAGTAIGQRLTA